MLLLMLLLLRSTCQTGARGPGQLRNVLVGASSSLVRTCCWLLLCILFTY